MPNLNPERVLAKAEHIAELRKQLADEEAEFGRLLGRSGPAARVSGPRSNGAPIAQQVLSVLASGPHTRGELIAKLGHEAAVTSALKKHKERGSIDNGSGKWEMLATPATTVTPVETPTGARKARTGK